MLILNQLEKFHKIYDHKSKVFCCYQTFSTMFKKSLSSNFFQVNFIPIFPHSFEFIIKYAFPPKFFFNYFFLLHILLFVNLQQIFNSTIYFLTKGFLNIEKTVQQCKKTRSISWHCPFKSATLHPSQSSPSPNNYSLSY